MKFIPFVLRSTLIVTLYAGIVFGAIDSKKNDRGNQTIETIKECMSRSPAPWPDEWKKEYLETIRSSIELNLDAAHYMTRLEILRNGFESYWRSIKKNQERSLFEVHRAQIRWFTEHLMRTEFPSKEERLRLREQFTEIWEYAASTLLKQFPFLDPNAVQAAKADDLSICYRKINAPLMPAYLRPMSEEQVERIKQGWDKLRYRRVDLWRRLSDNSKTPVENRDSPSSNAERDYELAQRSLSQLLGQVWVVASERPDYYISALKDRSRAIQDLLKSKRQAWNNESRLEKTRSKQLLQTEHIGFLLSALLETTHCLERIPDVVPQDNNALEQKELPAKGGDAYELGNTVYERY